MDPNLTPDPQMPPQAEADKENSSTLNNLSQKSGEIIHNNYETWIRKLFGFLFTILSFLRSTTMQIISQVFSK